MATKPLIVVVGPTASGKSALAMELARKFNGEIICADSRTVYKGMDIGTAKPSTEDQKQIKHHLLDIALPNERFTVADFKRLANKAINDISARNKLPIMVGGTGLYVDAVLYDFKFANQTALRDPINPRHLDKNVTVNRHNLRPNTLIVGLNVDREELKKRIDDRVTQMVKKGLEKEANNLSNTYSSSSPGLDAIGYKQWHQTGTTKEAKNEIIRDTVAYAKRQQTWFKRNKSIQWVEKQSEAVDLATTFLNKTIS